VKVTRHPGRRRWTGPVLLAVLVAAVLVPTGAGAHKYYAALTRITFNAHTGSMEVVHRFFADDFDLAISRRAGRRLSLDDLGGAGRAAIETAAEGLIRAQFSLSAEGHRIGLEFVGLEPEGDVVWAYFEAPGLTPPAVLDVDNRLLVAEFEGQSNLLTIRLGKQVRSGNFNARDSHRSFDLSGPPPAPVK